MAGEISKSAALTNAEAGIKRAARLNRGKAVVAIDAHQYAAASELEAGDTVLMNIRIPSNAIILDIEVQNDDMDTNACAPTLTTDVGLAAAEAFTSVTSGTATKHAAGEVLSADLLVDGVTTLRAASSNWVSLAPDASSFGPEDRLKPAFELLGYDFDPRTEFLLSVESDAAAAALGAAADLVVKVTYLVD